MKTKHVLLVLLFCIGFGVLLASTFFSKGDPVVPSEATEDTMKDLEESEFFKYIEGASYILGEENSGGSYNITLNVLVNSSFDNLERWDIIGMTSHFYEDYLQGDYVNCGNRDCFIREFVLTSPENEYKLVDEEEYTEFRSLLINGEDKYTFEEFKERNGKIADQEAARAAASEPTINGTRYSTIHTYMKVAYEELTNYGESYDPEYHDPLVAKLAADEFGITKAEAGRIYEKIEMEALK
ncbi:hypothetical protein [Halobacillus trueperi]|uniref:Uncharacterized protein n=1 Tax=Halobacillus trueperi TaxID=156205 RepID=A0A3E0J831_9BACI|nr:hypothetical protein [Halobacillus trueperi]REJ09082.1 hypothetical protein DYE48_11970 [Halobacillus trueperi]